MAKLDEFGWLERAENKVRKLRKAVDRRHAAGNPDPYMMNGLASVAASLRHVRAFLEGTEFIERPLPSLPTPYEKEVERVFMAKVKAQNAEIKTLYPAL